MDLSPLDVWLLDYALRAKLYPLADKVQDVLGLPGQLLSSMLPWHPGVPVSFVIFCLLQSVI